MFESLNRFAQNRARAILRLSRNVFGDPSPDILVSTAKSILCDPNAPLQEQAAALERLSAESDADSKSLILRHAGGTRHHEWLQQVAREAVGFMLEKGTLRVDEIAALSPIACDAAIAVLGDHDDQLLGALRSSVSAIPRA